MNTRDHQQKMEILCAVGALAPLVTALYDASETVALNTVTNSIREALAASMSVTLKEDGAIKPGPATDSVGAGKSYTASSNTDMDVVITLNGQKATGKTVLANKIIKLLRSEGFLVGSQETDGSVEVLRVINPAERFRDAGRTKPQVEANQATGKPPCDCAGCRLNRGEAVTDAEKAAVEQYNRLFEALARTRVFTFGG